ncbi:MAG TPA: IPT/TIG domain-containing protein [Bryobacteraceae bacterium]|nr:IPT/TIG domain-containing protein [Bryobacteraceae bacterium]
MTIRGGAGLLVFAGAMMAQTFDNTTLNGKYYFRHLLFTADASDNITDIRCISGAMTFDGAGNFAFAGQQTIGVSAPAAANGAGTYSVSLAGMVTLTNPQNFSLTLNAHYGVAGPGEAMVIGSSTEAAGGTFDLFIAVQAPSPPTSNVSLTGGYWVSTLAFPTATAATARSTLFSLQADGQGGFASFSVTGHAANISNGAPTTQALSGATYSMAADGSGTATFPLTAANNAAGQLLSGHEAIYVSGSGNVILGGSTDPGVHDLLVGFKSQDGLAWLGEFWHAGLRFETQGLASAYSGSLYSTGLGTITFTRRLHQLNPPGAVSYDFTGANPYQLQRNGSGTAELTSVGLGAGGSVFAGAAVDPNDTAGYELYLGVRMPGLSGGGVFLNPQGIVNAASFAPAGDSIAPGEFIALFGTGLAGATQTALPPYPPNLGGVTVLINNQPAPIQYVSATQIHALVPYGTSGPAATIVVTNNGQSSEAAPVPVAATAPGVFSLSQNGIGPGAILHTNFSLVNAANPAKRSETVLVFLTGLGAVNPPVADGAAGGSNPFNRAVAQVNVLVGGLPATVSFAGLAPGFPGLYQLNVVVPADLTVNATGPFPLAIQTADSFHDQVDLIVGQ